MFWIWAVQPVPTTSALTGDTGTHGSAFTPTDLDWTSIIICGDLA